MDVNKKRMEHIVAQLRHAYSLLHDKRTIRKEQAVGDLISQSIQRLEIILKGE